MDFKLVYYYHHHYCSYNIIFYIAVNVFRIFHPNSELKKSSDFRRAKCSNEQFLNGRTNCCFVIYKNHKS